jgi:hypothetical protein
VRLIDLILNEVYFRRINNNLIIMKILINKGFFFCVSKLFSKKIKFFYFFYFKLIFFMILDCFNILKSKINYKKYYLNIFLNNIILKNNHYHNKTKKIN